MENGETINIWCALSPTLGEHFLHTAAKQLPDDDPTWETSIGVTFRFHRHPISSDNSVEVAQSDGSVQPFYSTICINHDAYWSRPVYDRDTGVSQRAYQFYLWNQHCSPGCIACMAERHANEAATTDARAVMSKSRKIDYWHSTKCQHQPLKPEALRFGFLRFRVRLDGWNIHCNTWKCIVARAEKHVMWEGWIRKVGITFWI